MDAEPLLEEPKVEELENEGGSQVLVELEAVQNELEALEELEPEEDPAQDAQVLSLSAMLPMK